MQTAELSLVCCLSDRRERIKGSKLSTVMQILDKYKCTTNTNANALQIQIQMHYKYKYKIYNELTNIIEL